ncbi:MAG: diguanylate cyclase [Thermoleophilaceae bacterium]
MTADNLKTLARLGAIFERTASVRDEHDLQVVLEDLCEAISELLGYRAVVVNVYRPAYDDMLAAAAVGSEEGVKALVGRASPAETWHPLLADRFERGGAYFVPGDEFDWEALGADSFVPDIEPSDHPDAWTAEDALFVPLHDAKGGLIGVISVDEPETGRRPSDGELDALVAIARHAALALRIAQETANTAQHQRMLEGVLAVSARLAEADETEDILQAVCDGIHDALGFDRVVIELADGPGEPLRPAAATGWENPAAGMTGGRPIESLAPLFTEEFDIAGCFLIPTEVAEERLGAHPSGHRSEMNGHGPYAWARHWLLVPLEDQEGGHLGVISVDDPRDRLLPTRARLQALRLFANQAVAALQTADRAVRLRHEATHDPLTSLPNRRAFLARLNREAASSDGQLAVILCDMDNLKLVNDRYGHQAGDRALVALADALRNGLRRSDDAFRLGGDEFAVVLGGASRLDAKRVVRRLQRELSTKRAEGQDIEASFGIAAREPGETPEQLVTRADELLYRAKRRRRRSVA